MKPKRCSTPATLFNPFAGLGLALLIFQPLVAAPEPTANEVVVALQRAADWQLANPSEKNLNSWIIAPFYDGLLRMAEATGDPEYMADVIRFANSARWAPGSRIYMADDHAVGHAWLDLFLIDPSVTYRKRRIADRLDYVIANPITEALEFGKKVQTPGVGVTDRWTWCDALYMAPPTLTRLYEATSDDKYLDFLYQEFRYTYDLLYYAAEGFFYRDSNFIGSLTPNGQKVFWSRGNGWVYGGLALILEHLPQDHRDRPFYEELFLEMTVSVMGAQQADGLWRPSLADPAHVAVGESSGSGFFTFGLAWGINNGLLDRKTHWPAAEAGWRGLQTRIGTAGQVGYVQQPAAAPASFTASSTREYGTGAFLLAGSEILRAIGGAASVDPVVLLAQAEDLLNPPPAASPMRLVNLSTRVKVGPDSIAIQGFVVGGTSDRQILIRAIGPGLAQYGVPDAHADPRMMLYQGDESIATNDDWNAAELGDAFERAGAFPLETGSTDAAQLVLVRAGQVYTVHVTGDAQGVALIEIYVLPPSEATE